MSIFIWIQKNLILFYKNIDFFIISSLQNGLDKRYDEVNSVGSYSVFYLPGYSLINRRMLSEFFYKYYFSVCEYG